MVVNLEMKCKRVWQESAGGKGSMKRQRDDPRSTAMKEAKAYPFSAWLIAVLALLAAPAAFAQTPAGSQFLVNTYTTNAQRHPAVAAAADGTFVVAWVSGCCGGQYTVEGQRFASDGTHLGGQFAIDPNVGFNRPPSVAMDEDADFVVVWHEFNSAYGDPLLFSVHARRYDSNGNSVSTRFLVNTYTTASQSSPDVAMALDGDFIVVWESFGSNGSDSDSSSVQARRYASDGTAFASEFQVNTYTSSSQGYPAVVAEPNGNFVVVWQSGGSASDTSGYSVSAQRFLSDGSVVGSELEVNSYTTNDQRFPAVAMTLSGSFVVVWAGRGSPGNDDDYNSIQGRRFDSDGIAIAGDFQVNTYTTDNQYHPGVTADSDGGFVVVWRSFGSSQGESLSFAVVGQRYNSDGSAAGSDFQANTYTTGAQFRSQVAADAAGDFVVVWESTLADDDSSSRSIQAQRFRVTGDVGDTVWLDENGDGIQDAGEPGIGGVRVNLYRSASLVGSTETDPSGIFAFRPKPGDYTLEIELPPFYALTSQDSGANDTADSDPDPVTRQTVSFAVLENVADLDWDAGLVTVDGVGDRVWEDLDGNGVQDGGEPGFASVDVTLRDSVGTQIDQTSTDSDGFFSFEGFTPGDYYLEFTAPGGLAFTERGQGNDAFDSDVNPATGTTSVFSFDPGTIDRTLDAGLIAATAQVGDYVWIDGNLDGVQDGGEPGVANIEIQRHSVASPPFLTGRPPVELAMTDGDGFYSFTGGAGMFYLQVICPEEVLTAESQGTDDELDSDFKPSTQTTANFTLAAGDADGSWDVGLLDPDGDLVVCVDNCPADANADQADADGDSVGDVCDVCFGDNLTGDADGDGVCDDGDVCSGDDATGDTDSDNVCDDIDVCNGDDATGDTDGDGICADLDCDDSDPLDVCLVFNDGFESGDTTAWSSSTP